MKRGLRILFSAFLFVCVLGCKEGVMLNDMQVAACNSASRNNNCDRLNELGLVGASECCSALNNCCYGVTGSVVGGFERKEPVFMPICGDVPIPWWSPKPSTAQEYISGLCGWEDSCAQEWCAYFRAKPSEVPAKYYGTNNSQSGISEIVNRTNVTITALKTAVINAIDNYFTPNPTLTKNELKDLITTYSENKGNVVDISRRGRLSNKSIESIYKKITESNTSKLCSAILPCPSGQTCQNGACAKALCIAECAGKCGGAPDGCGGSCNTPCTPVITLGSAEDSPFGIFNPYEVFSDRPTFVTRRGINSYLKDLKVKWVQAMPREDVGELNLFIGDGFNVYSRAIPPLDASCPQKISNEYRENLRSMISKYKNKIKYWEADTEPENNPLYNLGEGWGRCPEEYAEFLKVTYEIIKRECNDCKVVFGGLGGAEVGLNTEDHQAKFLNSVLKAGGGNYFDVFEFKQHFHRENDYNELKNKMDVYSKILFTYGIDIYKMPVFIETAMYDGTPETLNDPPLPTQTESQQAAGLIKTYVFGTAHGIDKIFWNYVVERGENETGRKEIFNFYGLVHNPQYDGLSDKKLAYYTYKKMIETLEGSDWNNIQTVQEIDGVYVYKIIKQGKPVWVAWNDNPQEEQITIFGLTSSRVRITDAVPKYESGKEVIAYSSAFKTEIKTANDGVVTINLGEIPVFVEGIACLRICAGKCGGVPDGCGGTCNATCGERIVKQCVASAECLKCGDTCVPHAQWSSYCAEPTSNFNCECNNGFCKAKRA